MLRGHLGKNTPAFFCQFDQVSTPVGRIFRPDPPAGAPSRRPKFE